MPGQPRRAPELEVELLAVDERAPDGVLYREQVVLVDVRGQLVDLDPAGRVVAEQQPVELWRALRVAGVQVPGERADTRDPFRLQQLRVDQFGLAEDPPHHEDPVPQPRGPRGDGPGRRVVGGLQRAEPHRQAVAQHPGELGQQHMAAHVRVHGQQCGRRGPGADDVAGRPVGVLHPEVDHLPGLADRVQQDGRVGDRLQGDGQPGVDLAERAVRIGCAGRRVAPAQFDHPAGHRVGEGRQVAGRLFGELHRFGPGQPERPDDAVAGRQGGGEHRGGAVRRGGEIGEVAADGRLVGQEQGGAFPYRHRDRHVDVGWQPAPLAAHLGADAVRTHERVRAVGFQHGQHDAGRRRPADVRAGDGVGHLVVPGGAGDSGADELVLSLQRFETGGPGRAGGPGGRLRRRCGRRLRRLPARRIPSRARLPAGLPLRRTVAGAAQVVAQFVVDEFGDRGAGGIRGRGADDRGGHLDELDVGSLGQPDQVVEPLVGGHAEAFHENAFGLLDHGAVAHRGADAGQFAAQLGDQRGERFGGLGTGLVSPVDHRDPLPWRRPVPMSSDPESYPTPALTAPCASTREPDFSPIATSPRMSCSPMTAASAVSSAAIKWWGHGKYPWQTAV